MMMKLKNRRGTTTTTTTDGISASTTTSRKNNSNGGDEDLLLFRDMQKRNKDRIISLLQPVSDDFESNPGNYPLYRISSGKRSGLGGLDHFVGEGDHHHKNDYDWLKTPPATPLFPSLELEANAPDMAIQREITIIQPPSRFSGGNSEASKMNFKPNNKISSRSTTPSVPRIPSRSITPNTVPRPSSRSITPSAVRPQVPSTTHHDATNVKTIIQSNTKPSDQNSNYNNNNTTKLTNYNKPTENTTTLSKSKPSSRGVSPQVRSRIPATIPGFSDETPPNLRTDRSSSASRSRPTTPSTVTLIHPKQEAPAKPRRQSCSPSMSRGRRSMESNDQEMLEGDHGISSNRMKGKSSSSQVGISGGGSLAFGSKMVEKVMNARKSVSVVVEEKETKLKVGASSTTTHHNKDSSGFGRMMSKSSLAMALKHMEIRRDSTNFHRSQAPKNVMVVGLKSDLDSTNRTSQVQASWKRKEKISIQRVK